MQPDGQTGQDLWITSVYDYGDNYGVDNDFLEVGGWGDSYYSLLRFDLTGLPASAVSATIVLQPFARTELGADDQSSVAPMSLYRANSSWNENVGWPDQPTATFLRSLPAPTIGSPYEIDVTDIYNGWRADPESNFGIELRPTSTDNRFDVFRSSDYSDASLRPKLVVRGTAASADHFTWPTDPENAGVGSDAPCDDWPADAMGCYSLGTNGWRDVQPFLRHLYVDDAGKVLGYHLGADWNLFSDPADKGKPVYAIADGEIVSILENVARWGNIVFVKHTTTFGVFTSMYAHVDWAASGKPALGAVKKGDQIAIVGNGNNQYPYHLHLEIRTGLNTTIGSGYISSRSIGPPQGQIDPDAFIAAHHR